MLRIGIVCMAVLISCTEMTDTFEDEAFGCRTKKDLLEVMNASEAENNNKLKALFETKCSSVEGLKYSVVESGKHMTQVRIHVDGHSLLNWVPTRHTK